MFNKRSLFHNSLLSLTSRNKRGISAIVATVMIILITVAAIGILWAAIIPMIQTSLDFSSLEGRVYVLEEGYTAYDSTKNIASVQVKRDVDEGVMNNIKISFDISGNSYSEIVAAPTSGGKRVYYFAMKNLGEPDSVSVAPIFAVGNKEKEGEITSTTDMSKASFDSASYEEDLTMPVDIEIASASYITSTYVGPPVDRFIKINGEVKATPGRSYAIVMLDSNWNYIEYKKYDVYGSTSDRDSMVYYLNGLSKGSIVLLSTYDEPSKNLAGDLADALKDLGATSERLNQIVSRGTYILVGRKGAGEGNYYAEKVGPNEVGVPIYYNSSF